MEEFDCKELLNMSTKEYHVLEFWRKALIKCFKERGPVSAGQVAKSIGQSRTTGKKYLDKLVAAKCAATKKELYKTGVEATHYYPVMAA